MSDMLPIYISLTIISIIGLYWLYNYFKPLWVKLPDTTPKGISLVDELKSYLGGLKLALEKAQILDYMNLSLVSVFDMELSVARSNELSMDRILRLTYIINRWIKKLSEDNSIYNTHSVILQLKGMNAVIYKHTSGKLNVEMVVDKVRMIKLKIPHEYIRSVVLGNQLDFTLFNFPSVGKLISILNDVKLHTLLKLAANKASATIASELFNPTEILEGIDLIDEVVYLLDNYIKNNPPVPPPVVYKREGWFRLFK
jgi:hypothetical protein